MQPLNFSSMSAFISTGSAQLLVGPASSRVREQIKVRSSMRATSLGCERARNELGRNLSLSRTNVPLRTINSQSAWYSPSEPSHQCTLSAWHNQDISWTHER